MSKRYLMSGGLYDLDVTVDDDADLDSTFTAICNDTGETLRVNGWLFSEIEEIKEVEAA